MSPRGYFKLARKQFRTDGTGCELWNEPREFSRWEAWVDMIQLAAYEPHVILIGNHRVSVERGETRPLSLRFLARRWGWGLKRVRLYLNLLIGMERIRAHQDTPDGHTYLLENYERYQYQGHSEGTDKGTARAHPGHKGEGRENKGEGKKQTKARVRARESEQVEIPEALIEAIPDFEALWAERLKSAKEKKRSPTETGERSQLRRLAALLDQPGAVNWIRRRIDDAIGGGWQSVLPNGLPKSPAEESSSNGNRTHKPLVSASRYVVPHETDEQRALTEKAMREEVFE